MPSFVEHQTQSQETYASPSRRHPLTPALEHHANSILKLQRSVGNQAVLRMLQTKLAVNSPGDTYEQEADHVSEHVMRMPEPQLQRACVCGGSCARCQTEQPSQERGPLQMKSPSGDMGESVAPPIVEDVLRSSGQPLDPATRAFMEPRFGQDFSGVRVHSDTAAEQSAQAVNAQAYTAGRHIVFAADRFAPATPSGRQLIAHELAHVVQQSRAGVREGGGSLEGSSSQVIHRQPKKGDADHGKSVEARLEELEKAGAVKDQAQNVEAASKPVEIAYGHVFDNQHTGLERLKDALDKKDESPDFIAILAGVAVAAAVTALLGPVGPALAGALKLGEDEIAGEIILKGAEIVTRAAAETAKEGVKTRVSGSKADAIANFIEAQSLTINAAKDVALNKFVAVKYLFETLPNGVDVLHTMAKIVEGQANIAADVQVAHSAGEWAHFITKPPGHGSQDWVNRDVEGYRDNPEVSDDKGELELHIRVTKAPITGPGDIQIIESNWSGINANVERLVQQHGGATIGDLGTNLRITLETPMGETRCEILAYPGNPVIPSESTYQNALLWLIHVEPSGIENTAGVLSAAHVLGIYLKQKPTSDLRNRHDPVLEKAKQFYGH